MLPHPILRRALLHYTKTARAERTRLATTWCDYSPAHFGVRWKAFSDGRPFGQSCFHHLGALLIDVTRAGGSVGLERTKDGVDPKHPERLEPFEQP